MAGSPAGTLDKGRNQKTEAWERLATWPMLKSPTWVMCLHSLCAILNSGHDVACARPGYTASRLSGACRVPVHLLSGAPRGTMVS